MSTAENTPQIVIDFNDDDAFITIPAHELRVGDIRYHDAGWLYVITERWSDDGTFSDPTPVVCIKVTYASGEDGRFAYREDRMISVYRVPEVDRCDA